MSLTTEFKAFVMRGNVIDLAVGVVIGAAFGKIVTSLVNDVIMPPIGLALGAVDFSDLFINLSDTDYPSLAAAKEAGADVAKKRNTSCRDTSLTASSPKRRERPTILLVRARRSAS